MLNIKTEFAVILHKLKIIKHSYVCQAGFSLVEVMVAALIMSFGLLAFVQAQWVAFRISQHAYWLSVAALKNHELAERFRSCHAKPACIQQELSVWKREVMESIPQGEGKVSSQHTDYQSEIDWTSLYYSSSSPYKLYLLFYV